MQRDELVSQLTALHGAALVAVVLYGSAASDDHVAGHSDQNILVIVETLGIDTLRAMAQTARAWQEAGNPPPLMLTRREWLGSADIFPMEYADILERHRVLTGVLPLDGVRVELQDLRLQVEQEALGKLLRLRRAVMTAGADVARQREVLRASASALLAILRSVLRLHGVVPPRDALEVISAVAAHTGIPADPFQQTVRMVRGGALPDAQVDAVVQGTVRGMEALTAHLDQFTAPNRSA